MFCRNCGKDVVETAEICPACGAKPLAGKSFCPACGSPTTVLSEMCTKCGTRLAVATPAVVPVAAAPPVIMAPAGYGDVSPKSRLVTTLLAWILGIGIPLGVHRFYVGRIGSGIAQLILGTILGVGTYLFGVALATGGLAVAGVSNIAGLAVGTIGLVFMGIGGVLWGAISLWGFIDAIIAAVGKFKDKKGRRIVNWSNK